MDDDRYEVLDVVGSGGMATVWRARDRRLGRYVAVKRPNHVAAEPVDRRRFAREARAADRVAHPNVVAVHDAGVDERGPYLVMELVDGPSLPAAKIPADQVGRIGAQVASALAALHAAGVVHGDVKPGNILLASDGAKLTDFGIARAADDTMTVAMSGVTFATPAYAAPETLSHGERTEAADVYSLAAVVYELLTGTRWNPAAATTQPMPPAGWARVLAPALSEDPRARPNAAAFAASLAAAADAGEHHAATTRVVPAREAPAGAPPVAHAVATPDRARRLAVALFVGALTAVIGVVALAAWLDDRETGSGAQATDPASLPAPAVTTVPVSTASVTTAPVTTAPVTTAPVTSAPVTTAPATTAPVTTAPTTSAPATTAPRTPVVVAEELIAVIDAVPRRELKVKEARELGERVDDLMRTAADDPEDADEQLGDTAERLAEQLGGDARAQARALMVELATMLGLDPAPVIDAFDGASDDEESD